MSNYISKDNKNLNLPQRKNFRDNEAKIAEEIEKLSKVVGFPLTFEWRCTPEILAKAQTGFDQRPGEACLWHVAGVVEVLIEQLQDDMTKEAFGEAVSKKTFVLQPSTEEIGYNARWAIKDGEFMVEYQDINFANNCGADWVRGNNKVDKLL